jgi:hypothetical protein
MDNQRLASVRDVLARHGSRRTIVKGAAGGAATTILGMMSHKSQSTGTLAAAAPALARWSTWEPVTGDRFLVGLTSPAASARGEEIAIAIRGRDNHLFTTTNRWVGEKWRGWQPWQEWLPDRGDLDVVDSVALLYEHNLAFWRDSHGHIRVWSLGSSEAPDDLGGPFTLGPAIAYSGPPGVPGVNVFARAASNFIYELSGYWEQSQGRMVWQSDPGWTNLEGTVVQGLAAAHRSGNTLDLFHVGDRGQLWHRWKDWREGWIPVSEWENFFFPGTGPLSSAPAAVSWGTGRIDVFARGSDNHLWSQWWNGSAWSGWDGGDHGGTLLSAPAATSWGPNRLAIFHVGTDSRVYWKWYV